MCGARFSPKLKRTSTGLPTSPCPGQQSDSGRRCHRLSKRCPGALAPGHRLPDHRAYARLIPPQATGSDASMNVS